MNALLRITTAPYMLYALTWKDHLNVNANQDLQEMEKHVMVGYGGWSLTHLEHEHGLTNGQVFI